MTSLLLIENQHGMDFSIAWGLNPRLLKMKIGNKSQNVIPFSATTYKTFRMARM
jgi:hypothetical protein